MRFAVFFMFLCCPWRSILLWFRIFIGIYCIYIVDMSECEKGSFWEVSVPKTSAAAIFPVISTSSLSTHLFSPTGLFQLHLHDVCAHVQVNAPWRNIMGGRKYVYCPTPLHPKEHIKKCLKRSDGFQPVGSNVHFVRKGCDGPSKIAILPQFLTSNLHFACKGCPWHLKIAILPQFLTSNVHFVRKGCDGLTKIAFLHQFLTSNVHFVRKGCNVLTKIAI